LPRPVLAPANEILICGADCDGNFGAQAEHKRGENALKITRTLRIDEFLFCVGGN
jgi:hypothetical protein